MEKIYSFPPKEAESTPGVFRISYHNVELASYVHQKSEELLKQIPHMDLQRQKSFLRAFFDDEGSVYFINKKRLVRGYQHSPKILNLVRNLLKNFQIESKVDEKYNEVTIGKIENIVRFRDSIGFSKGIYINPERSNSVWRRKLEKRHILDTAIASYRAL